MCGYSSGTWVAMVVARDALKFGLKPLVERPPAKDLGEDVLTPIAMLKRVKPGYVFRPRIEDAGSIRKKAHQ